VRKAIGSRSDPVILLKVRQRLIAALETLALQVKEDVRAKLTKILHQIENDLKMLRASEAKVLAKNGHFLEQLGKVVESVLVDMDRVKAATDLVKVNAKQDGYI
jgi:glutamine synthetase type III